MLLISGLQKISIPAKGHRGRVLRRRRRFSEPKDISDTQKGMSYSYVNLPLVHPVLITFWDVL